MSMEADLVARLAAWPAVAAAIGTTGGTASISWGLPLQGTAQPWLVISKVSPGRDYTHAGPDGLDGPRVQFDALAIGQSENRWRSLDAHTWHQTEHRGRRRHHGNFTTINRCIAS